MLSMAKMGVTLKTSVKKPDTSKALNATAWAQLEQYYTELITQIHVPEDPDTNDIKFIVAALDSVYAEARLDLAKARRGHDRIERKYKLAMKEAYLAVKDAGKTEKDKEALAVAYIRTTKLDADPMPVTDMLDIAEERYLFMQAVVDVLNDKSGKCITENGLLRIDVELGGQGT